MSCIQLLYIITWKIIERIVSDYESDPFLTYLKKWWKILMSESKSPELVCVPYFLCHTCFFPRMSVSCTRALITKSQSLCAHFFFPKMPSRNCSPSISIFSATFRLQSRVFLSCLPLLLSMSRDEWTVAVSTVVEVKTPLLGRTTFCMEWEMRRYPLT